MSDAQKKAALARYPNIHALTALRSHGSRPGGTSAPPPTPKDGPATPKTRSPPRQSRAGGGETGQRARQSGVHAKLSQPRSQAIIVHNAKASKSDRQRNSGQHSRRSGRGGDSSSRSSSLGRVADKCGPLARIFYGLDEPIVAKELQSHDGRFMGRSVILSPSTFTKMNTVRKSAEGLHAIRKRDIKNGHAGWVGMESQTVSTMERIAEHEDSMALMPGSRNKNRGFALAHGDPIASSGDMSVAIGPSIVGYSMASVPHTESAQLKNGVKSTIIRGSDYLGEVATVATTTAARDGQRLLVLPMAPLYLAGTRLAAESRLFQEYILIHAEVVFVPATGTSTVGSLLMYKDDDPANSHQITGDDLLRHAQAHDHWKLWPVWQEAALEIYRSPVTGPKFSGNEADPRLGVDGIFVIMCGPGCDNSTNTVYGSLYLRYIYRFFSPTTQLLLDSPSENSLTLTWGQSSFPTTNVAGNPIAMYVHAASNSTMSAQFGTNPASLGHKMFYGVVRDFSFAWTGDVESAEWYTDTQGSPGSGNGLNWAVGQAFFIRAVSTGDDPAEYDAILLFESLEAALPTPPDSAGAIGAVAGQLRYAADGNNAGWVWLDVKEVDYTEYI